MNVFIIGTPFETAQALDRKRLNKQIIECKQILAAIDGDTEAWINHPATIQYRKHPLWLRSYLFCLCHYRNAEVVSYEQLKKDEMRRAKALSVAADEYRPPFHTEAYFDSMKRRLYTKDPEHYAQWADLGTSEVNWYWSPTEDKFIHYRDGKRIKGTND